MTKKDKPEEQKRVIGASRIKPDEPSSKKAPITYIPKGKPKRIPKDAIGLSPAPGRTINEIFRDLNLRHDAWVDQLSDDWDRKINGVFKEANQKLVNVINILGGDITRKQALKGIRDARTPMWKAIKKSIQNGLEKHVKNEVKFMDKSLKAFLPIVIQKRIDKRGMEGKILKARDGLANPNNVKREIIRIASREENDLIDAVMRLKISNPNAMKDDIEDIIQPRAKITYDRMKTLERTSRRDLTSRARSEIIKDNLDIIFKEQFLATLDAGTTLECAVHDGRTYPIGEAPRPPLHWRCRSQVIPIFSDEIIGNRPANPYVESEMIGMYCKENKLPIVKKYKDIPRGHKTKFNTFKRKTLRKKVGPVPASTTYKDWFSQQSEAYQNKVIGKRNAEKYRKGETTLDKLWQQKGKPSKTIEI